MFGTPCSVPCFSSTVFADGGKLVQCLEVLFKHPVSTTYSSATSAEMLPVLSLSCQEVYLALVCRAQASSSLPTIIADCTDCNSMGEAKIRSKSINGRCPSFAGSQIRRHTKFY
jgi:hypothetical protein